MPSGSTFTLEFSLATYFLSRANAFSGVWLGTSRMLIFSSP